LKERSNKYIINVQYGTLYTFIYNSAT